MAAEWTAGVGDWSRGGREEWQGSEVALWRDRRGLEESGTLESVDVSAQRAVARQVWTVEILETVGIVRDISRSQAVVGRKHLVQI